MEQLKFLKEDLLNRTQENYSKIVDIFSLSYNWPLLDSIRQEIIYCILIGCTQAAVTLTNHLLEKSLKAILQHSESIDQNYTNLEEIANHFEKLNKTYSDMRLFDTIDACYKKNFLTNEQQNVLNKFRKQFRNPFSHANAKTTFGEIKKKVGIFNPLIHKEIQTADMKVANFPFLQDMAQKQICDEEGIDFFRYVDSLIREIMPKIFQLTALPPTSALAIAGLKE